MSENAWNKLLEFESRDLIDRYIRQKYNRDASARQVLEISSNFIQGREYFKNARRADFSVKPLLLYYGVAALSRGLILALWPHISESALRPSHGLDTTEWQAALTNKDFGSLSVTITAGTFAELLQTTGNKAYLKAKSSAFNYYLQYDVPAVGTQFSLKQLLQSMPDLEASYQSWTGEKLYYAPVDSFTHFPGERITFSFPEFVNTTVIEAIFDAETYPGCVVGRQPGQILVTIDDSTIPQFSQLNRDAFQLGIGDVTVTKAIGASLRLNSLSQLYSASFFLGMLCRYFPATWLSLRRTEKGDAIYPLVIDLLGIIERQFPNLVVGFLAGPYDFENTPKAE